ncbi:hypothetical protein S245_048441, partial [Arachis hypogaea]
IDGCRFSNRNQGLISVPTMAFFGRIGNLLRNAANKQISSELLSSPSILQAIRCMSSAPSSKLFIGGVSYSTDEQGLREAFSRYGEVVDVVDGTNPEEIEITTPAFNDANFERVERLIKGIESNQEYKLRTRSTRKISSYYASMRILIYQVQDLKGKHVNSLIFAASRYQKVFEENLNLSSAGFESFFLSYLHLAHIYERANQVFTVYFGIAVGFYQ